MKRLDELGEKAIVSNLIQLFDPDGARNLGDDCAVLDLGRDYLLVTTDIINRKTHIPEGAEPRDVGWHATAINISDIAAMGGQPLGMLIAFGLPAESRFSELEEIAGGIRECCSTYGVHVLGGDTKESELMTISGTAIGTVPKSEILWRKGARPGDIVAMTGALGKPTEWYRNKDTGRIKFLLRVVPRIREGRILAQSRAVTSCIDTSDGLSTSLHHLARSGEVGFEVEFDRLPFALGLSPEENEKATHLGGDYELLFTVSPDRTEQVFNADFGSVPITQIGSVTDDAGVFINKDGASQPLPDKGYEHFGGGK
jgi:thiamine-monophosphate kinase